MAHLTFEEPDTETFPLLRIAFDCLKAGGGATVVLNAANEVAVGAFLERRIGFADIARTVEAMLSKLSAPLPETEGDILELDRRTRAATADYLKP
jgi:1-deoxy-D-xylulose-5-phosphate reductoisomerase